MLEAVGNVTLGIDQKIARDTNDSFMWGATGIRWQLSRLVGNVTADYGKIPIGKFKNVRASSGFIA